LALVAVLVVKAAAAALRAGAGIPTMTTQNNMEVIPCAVRQFFVTMGVNLDPLLGKSIFFNDRKGELFVRATPDELDLIEQDHPGAERGAASGEHQDALHGNQPER
jgi:hypothetical protein